MMKKVWNQTVSVFYKRNNSKALMATMVALSFGLLSFANPKDAHNNVANDIKKTFGEVKNEEWKETKEFTKVRFVKNQQLVEVYYSPEGALIGTSKNIPFEKIPVLAADQLTKKYFNNGFELKQSIEFIDDNDEVSYYVSVQNNKKTVILQISLDGGVVLFSNKG